MDIDKAVVLVTGASSGIGAATARAASSAGAQVVLLARRTDRIRRLADELGEAVFVRCDVTDAGEVDAAVRAATEAFGRIDVLCNIAGQGLHAPLEEIDPDDFRAILELNLVAPLVTMQAVLPIMRKQGSGSIVNVSSGITFSALPGSAAYGASKAGLSKLSPPWHEPNSPTQASRSRRCTRSSRTPSSSNRCEATPNPRHSWNPAMRRNRSHPSRSPRRSST
jgi:NADP-dependent 3-hydroxy acid dehydrogenase YdfG